MILACASRRIVPRVTASSPARASPPPIRANSSRPSRSARTPGSEADRLAASRPRPPRRGRAGGARSPSSCGARRSPRRPPRTAPRMPRRPSAAEGRAGPAPRSTFGRRPEHVGRHPAQHAGASARYATRTLTAPYASSPGPATSRSPTSRCTITTYRSIGAVSNWSSSERDRDVVREVRDHRPCVRRRARWPSRCASRRRRRSARSGRSRRPRRALEQTRGPLDREDLGPGLGERDRQGPEPGAHLHDAVAVADAGVRHDRAGEVGVGEEVLAPILVGRIP